MKKKLSIITLVIISICASMLSGCIGMPSTSRAAKAPYEVTVEEYFICDAYDGEVFVVNLSVTNKTKEYVDAYMISYSITATNDGTVLNMGYLSEDSDNYINSDIKIASDETATVQVVYDLTSKAEGEVILKGVAYTEKGDKQVEFLDETIDLAEVEKKITESNYELAIDNVLKTDDGEGNDLIVIDMTFTNNSDESTSFSSAVGFEIFQNGTGLKRGYLPYRHPAQDDDLDGNNSLDIKGGNSIKVRAVYTLNDSSAPIEVKALDQWSYGTEPLFDNEIQIQ